MYLDGLPTRTFKVSLACATLLMLAAFAGLRTLIDDTTVWSAFYAFTFAVLIWGWMELGFLTGIVTGPRRTECIVGCAGLKHAWHAVEAILYHEFAIIGGALVIYLLSRGHANQVGLQTYLVLWIMRSSAKLNLFLGVRNLGEVFLPDHLRYLQSFLRVRRMNVLFPFSVTIGTAVAVVLFQHALDKAADPFVSSGTMLVAALLALAVLEHWFMMLPLPTEKLWGWGFKSRHHAGIGARAAGG